MPRRSSSSSSSSSFSTSSSSFASWTPICNRPLENSNVYTVSVSLPILASGSSILPIVAAGSSGNQLVETSVSTVSVSLPILTAPIGTITDISLTLSAALRQKRTRKSKPAPRIIFPVDINTIQKSHNRDGNESEGDVRTDDSILEEESS